MDSLSVSVAEYEHVNEMQDSLSRKLKESQRKDASGRGDALRSTVLSSVVTEEYDRAKEEIVAYVDLKFSFPIFQHRVQRLVQHCRDLIEAIRTKRNFPGLTQLSLSKQQEIHEKVLEHFEDLKRHLRQVEKIEREYKLEDVRSTVWVLRALVNCIALITLLTLFIDVKNGAFAPFLSVTDGYLEGVTTWLVNLVHF